MATLVAGDDVEKLEESGRVWKWKEAGCGELSPEGRSQDF